MAGLVKNAPTVPFEASQQGQQQRQTGQHGPLLPGSALSGHEQGDDDVAQGGVDQHAVVEAAPKRAAGLVLGGEDVDDHVYLGE